MTTNAPFIVIFCSSYETKAKDNGENASSLSFVFFPYIVKDNDEPPHSLSSFANFKKKQKKKHKKT